MHGNDEIRGNIILVSKLIRFIGFKQEYLFRVFRIFRAFRGKEDIWIPILPQPLFSVKRSKNSSSTGTARRARTSSSRRQVGQPSRLSFRGSGRTGFPPGKGPCPYKEGNRSRPWVGQRRSGSGRLSHFLLTRWSSVW